MMVLFFLLSEALASKSDEEQDVSERHRSLKGTILADDAMFSDLLPLETPDYIGFACAVAGLMLAAGGGIGGGGILVPIYILLFEFPVKRKYSPFGYAVLLLPFIDNVYAILLHRRHSAGIGYCPWRRRCQQHFELF